MRSLHPLSIAFSLALVLSTPQSRGDVAFEIGSSDNLCADFALAPANFEKFDHDVFFVAGKSSAADWPYVHPGPADSWAGSRQHTFTIVFGLKAAPQDGVCHFKLDFLDIHSSKPPVVRVSINGTKFERRLPSGAGDDSIRGNASKGRQFVWDLPFPSTLLRAGENEMLITTLSGSWLLYDSLSLSVPGPVQLQDLPSSTKLLSAQAPPVWLRTETNAVQPLTVVIRHIGREAPTEFRLDGKAFATLKLRNGSQTIQTALPTTETPRTAKLTLAEPGSTSDLATMSLRLAPPRIREMWLLPHSHVDIGYTHRQSEIIDVQIANLRTALRLARETATNPPGMRFKWNPEAVWTLDHFLERATPEERDEFIAAVKKGDIGVDALYGNLLTGLSRPEELVQGLAFGARISNVTGVPVRSASICDVPGWTWGMVPIMAQAGVKYFAIGPNYRDRVGTIHVWDNKPFYWKSQSGRERLLCWVVDNYHFFGDLEPHVLAQAQKLDAIDFPYDTSFMFWVGRSPNGAVDNAPPDEKITEKVLAWNAKYAAPKVIIGLAGEYFAAFEAKHGAQVPEFSGDLTPYWEDGAGSTSSETAMNRRSADRLSQAETLQVLRRMKPAPQSDWDAAWKNVLLYTEHTWGAWCSISAPDDPFTLDQWRVKQGFALEADRQSRELLQRTLPAPISNLKSEISNSSTHIDVWNTTQYKRTDLAIVPAGFKAASVRDVDGRPVPSQRLASGELAFVAQDVPPFGAKRYRVGTEPAPGKGSAKAEGSTIRNDRLSLQIDSNTGAIRSLRLANSNEEFVDASAAVGLNDFRYVLGTNAAGAQSNGPVRITVVEPGPIVAVLRVESEAPGCNKLTRDIRVVHGLDRVALVNTLDRKRVRVKDGVHFGYGFRVPQGKIRMETPWAVVRPNEDQLPGACRNWYTVQRWVDISNDKTGITWAPVDAPLMEIGGMTANLLGSVEFHEWMTNAPDSQTIYSWAQNNHWHTNYKIDQPGVTAFEYILRPHAGGYSAAQSARFGIETTRPLIVSAAGGESAGSLFSIDSDDVLVESVKRSSDGKATIIRLFGVAGREQPVRLKWASDVKPASVWLTDLTERPLKEIGGSVNMPAYGVVHLRAEPK